MTITFSIINNLPTMNLQLINSHFNTSNYILEAIFILNQFIILKLLPTKVSNRFLGSEVKVISINDGAMGSGHPTERKTKRFRNFGPDIEIDLREIDKEKSSKRISEDSGATTPKQQHEKLVTKNLTLINKSLTIWIPRFQPMYL
jgi:hypothetical protein